MLLGGYNGGRLREGLFGRDKHVNVYGKENFRKNSKTLRWLTLQARL